jgi:transposase, IS5 family
MSLNFSLREPLTTEGSHTTIAISVKNSLPLLELNKTLPWTQLLQMIKPDLEQSAGPSHHLGRKLHVEIHLKLFLLQGLCRLTDREIAEQARLRADFRIFCAIDSSSEGLIPDHSQICRFRNRLSSGTVNQLNTIVLKKVAELGFTNFASMDLDSTVQEANIAYPSDACLIRKLAQKTQKVISCLQSMGHKAATALQLNTEEVFKKGRAYFFRVKNAPIEKTRKIFGSYYRTACKNLKPALKLIQGLKGSTCAKMPWNIKLHCNQLKQHALQYLKDVGHFVKTHTIKKLKILSFHALAVTCITKGKLGKTKEFGRQYQVGRFTGNFIHIFPCNDLKMNDKQCFQSVLRQAQDLAGEKVLKEVSTDKGYYSHANTKAPQKKMGINTDGVQRPKNVADRHQPSNKERAEELRRRRAGIEPLIAHLKSFGLGKSKMKSDRATLSQGYSSALFFNCHQIMRRFAKIA